MTWPTTLRLLLGRRYKPPLVSGTLGGKRIFPNLASGGKRRKVIRKFTKGKEGSCVLARAVPGKEVPPEQ